MRRKRQGQKMTIVGFVTPSDWDDDDDVIEISISTDDSDYIVESNKKEEELFDLLGEDVKVTGIVTEDGVGIKRINVTSYKNLSQDGYGKAA